MATFNINTETLVAGSEGDDFFVFPTGTTSDGVVNTMAGGLGNDYYEVDAATSVIIEDANGGTDTIRTTVNTLTVTLAANVENGLVGTSGTGVLLYGNTGNNTLAAENNTLTGALKLYGQEGNDILLGNAGANSLDGGTGVDVMRGYDGNDVYFVDSSSDQVIEDSTAGGTDIVYSSASFTLGANVENLTLTGNSDIIGSGNELNNTITDLNGGNNILLGQAGNDALNGGSGNDRLDGGTGNDTLNDTSGNNVLLGGDGNDILTAGSGNDNLDGGAGNDTLTGGTGNDILNGGAGNDTILGGAGNDVIDGGAGDDIVIDNNAVSGSSNILRGGDGNDLILANQNASDFTLGTTVDGGNGNDALVDNASSLSYTINGVTKGDVLNGGAGNDNYYLRAATGIDKVQIIDISGSDTIHIGGAVLPQPGLPSNGTAYTLGAANITNLQFTLAAGIENVDASGAGISSYLVGNTGNNLMIGSSASDVLIGGAGADTLDGRGGADNLLGGIGNDLYIINDSNDTIVEDVSGGIDTVWANASYKMENFVENLYLKGTANIEGNGNGLNNTIEGNFGANTIAGGDGNDVLFGGNDAVADTLYGGNGSDTMTGLVGDKLYGGTGNDTYYVSGGAVAYEDSNEGTDAVNSTGSYTLGANLENLTLTAGTVAWAGAGNDLSNYIKGNDGDNVLTDSTGTGGGSDHDTLEGGKGNDTYFMTWGNAGTDKDKIIETTAGGSDDYVYLNVTGLTNQTVNLTVGSGDLNQIEHLDLSQGSYGAYSGTLAFNVTASAANNYIVGSSQNDRIDGGAGNDELYGGAGNDSLIGGLGNDYLDGESGTNQLNGGAGNDIYTINSLNDSVVESTLTTGGIDTISAVQDLDINLSTTYQGVENAYGAAVAANVTLTGTNGIANTLGGSQVGTGVLTLIGGTGNDTYEIQGAGDITKVHIIETGTVSATDFDTVISSVSGYTLEANLEKLVLSETNSPIAGYGNTLDNTLIGNTQNNTLDGAAGNDRLEGGDGNDSLLGSAGNDTLLGGAGNDYLDGGTGNDRMEGGLGDDSYILDSTADIVVEGSSAGWDVVEITGNGTYTLAANVEDGWILDRSDLTAANLVGNSLDNVLEGNSLGNYLSGAAGNDALYGYNGNDTLDGGAGDDSLDGGTGTNTLIGGLGNDTYIVYGATDTIVESLAGGLDEVYINSSATDTSYTLASNVENLYGAGNASAITLIGNAIANTITGNALANTIDGGSGADIMAGGNGSDTYLVDTTADFVLDLGTVSSAADVILANNTSFNLASNGVGVEQLILNNGSLSVFGIGNQLDNIITVQGTGAAYLEGGGGNDTLTGGSGNDTLICDFGNDTLNGGAGADTLIGGLGNDVYTVDNTNDIIREEANEGTDSVTSTAVTYTLSANIETLTLGGSSNINGFGNATGNTLVGNAGDNTLAGLGGVDTLTGGSGNDVFVFTEHGAANADLVVDYVVGTDHVLLKETLFTGILDVDNNNILDAADFGAYNGTTWGTGVEHIAYNSTTGELWYSALGTGADKSLIATFGSGAHPSLTASDILLF